MICHTNGRHKLCSWWTVWSLAHLLYIASDTFGKSSLHPSHRWQRCPSVLESACIASLPSVITAVALGLRSVCLRLMKAVFSSALPFITFPFFFQIDTESFSSYPAFSPVSLDYSSDVSRLLTDPDPNTNPSSSIYASICSWNSVCRPGCSRSPASTSWGVDDHVWPRSWFLVLCLLGLYLCFPSMLGRTLNMVAS